MSRIWLVIASACFLLVGCFGENYSVGHPVVSMHVGATEFELEPIYIVWNTGAETTTFRLDDEEAFLEKVGHAAINRNEPLQFTFKDSKKDKGTYTDVVIEIFFKQDGKQQLVYEEEVASTDLQEERIIYGPNEAGTYELELKFNNGGHAARYVYYLDVK